MDAIEGRGARCPVTRGEQCVARLPDLDPRRTDPLSHARSARAAWSMGRGRIGSG
jgi:hypothetical protein